jgi:RNA polymerase sigma factor (sigma-70 family)
MRTRAAGTGRHPDADASRQDLDARADAGTSLHLLERVRAGDRGALDQLLRRCLPILRRWATGRLPSWARDGNDTDDLVQDALIKALRSLDAFEPQHDGALQAYLRRAVLNRIRDEYRRAKRRPFDSGSGTDVPAQEASPLERLIGLDAIARYEGALTRLKATDAQLIIARVELGQSYEEMMRAFDKPSLHATRVAVWRALARLAREMDRQEPPCAD